MRDSLIRALVPSPAVSAALAAFLATLGRPNNPDTLWHLALGRWIVTHRALPDISQFYYSATTGPGYDYAWLAQALLFGAHQLLGSAGIAVLNSAVAGFVFYFLYRLLEHESSNLVVNFAVLGLALAAITTYLSGRPVIFTLALFTLELFIVSEFTASVTRRAWSCVWLIPLFTALWANLHPGFVLAPLVVLAFLPLVKGWRRWVLAGVAASAVVAVLLNPYGWRLYLVPLETLKALPMLRSLTEWTGIAGGEAVLWGGLVALGTWGCAVRRQPASIVLLFGLSALAAGVSDVLVDDGHGFGGLDYESLHPAARISQGPSQRPPTACITRAGIITDGMVMNISSITLRKIRP
ncbi:MAG: hypothetical protein ABIK62_05640, partial [candidate division WOR-3 bacterium]